MNRQFLYKLRQIVQKSVRFSVHVFLGCALSLAGIAHAQESALPTPQSGIWVIKNPEKNTDTPSRSFAIDVQDSVLLAQIGDYDATGAPRFSVIAGALQADTSAPLTVSALQAQVQQYRGGRSFGGPAQSAHFAGSAGELTLRFTSSSTGTAQFSGEPELAIERIQLDTRRDKHPDVQTIDAFTGQLHALEGSQGLLPDTSFLLNITRQAQTGDYVLKLHASQADMPETFNCDEAPAHSVPSEPAQAQVAIKRPLRLKCAGEWLEQGIEANLTLDISGNEVLGMLQYSLTNAQGQKQQATAQLRGMRHFYETRNLRTGESVYSAYSDAEVQYVVPQSGIWIIPEELNGEPGRGFAIDVDGNTLALQVFGYETTGDSTFHIGFSPFAPGHITEIELRQPLASTQQNPGKASLSFDSMTSGTIALPGEPAKKIVRFALSGPPDARALSGIWRFTIPGKGIFSTKLVDIQGSTITSDDGLFSCSFVPLTSTQGQGNTLCNYWLTPQPDGTEIAYEFLFHWRQGLSDFYGQLIDIKTGTTTGTGISRIAYLGHGAAQNTLFSVGSQLLIPLRSGSQ